MRAFWGCLGFLLVTTALSTASAQPVMHEPWVDPDPDGPPERYELGEHFGIAPMAEYRAQMTFVNPISLTTETDRRYNVMEHRGRFGGTFDYDNLVMINLSMDLLDGVAWGDNGTFGQLPSSDIGMNLNARDPNVTRACVGQVEGRDPLSPEGYGYVSCEGDHLKVRRLYAQVNTPIGALRVGRQAVGVGMSVQNAAGDGRRNRFGVAYEGDQVDRILFATKPLEAFKPKELIDRSENNGLILALVYDRWVSDSGRLFSDDVNAVATALRYLQPDFGIGRNLEAQIFYAHRWNTAFASYVNSVGGRFAANFGGFHIGTDMAGNIGTTREVSEAYQVITNDPVVDQKILQYGARAVVRYDWRPDGDLDELPMITGYFEFDYASGDADPEPRTTLSQFRFSEDTNVGLLMFDHVLRFQTARSALAATEIAQRLGAVSFPTERIDTRGAFTNAMAIFPQVDFRPHDTVLFRGGVLVAWAPAAVNDPAQSLLRRDGQEIEDDLVNFVGGKPGNFYGTELDARFQWRFVDHFALDLEAAVLFPGDALEDENGQAVNSFLTQGRTTFFFD